MMLHTKTLLNSILISRYEEMLSKNEQIFFSKDFPDNRKNTYWSVFALTISWYVLKNWCYISLFEGIQKISLLGTFIKSNLVYLNMFCNFIFIKDGHNTNFSVGGRACWRSDVSEIFIYMKKTITRRVPWEGEGGRSAANRFD